MTQAMWLIAGGVLALGLDIAIFAWLYGTDRL